MMSDQYAVYLPAVNSTYASTVAKPLPNGRPFPQGHTIADLVFWSKRSKLWNHRQVLHSVGAYAVGSTPDNAITRMGRDDYLLIGDSGGFQIGKGSLKGFDALRAGMEAAAAVEAWQDAYHVREWIVGWLETYTHYAMTLDMPLWARLDANRETPFHQCSIQQLTNLTVSNLRFIDKHRQGRTKWLNVVQGLDEQTTQDWWNAVKWFDCSGYSLAGTAGSRGGIEAMLRTILMMRDDGAFASGRDWLHVLGVSTAQWAVLLSAIQRTLRKHVNPTLRVSYDSASVFKAGGEFEQVALPPQFGNRAYLWNIRFEQAPQAKEFVGSDEPFGYDSPIGRVLTKGHLNVVTDEWNARKFDTISNALLVNHNAWVYLSTFERANELAFETDREDVPPSWVECLDFIDEVFTAENWRWALDERRSLLNAVAPSEI
jgi:hypothetical protein